MHARTGPLDASSHFPGREQSAVRKGSAKMRAAAGGTASNSQNQTSAASKTEVKVSLVFKDSLFSFYLGAFVKVYCRLPMKITLQHRSDRPLEPMQKRCQVAVQFTCVAFRRGGLAKAALLAIQNSIEL